MLQYWERQAVPNEIICFHFSSFESGIAISSCIWPEMCILKWAIYLSLIELFGELISISYSFEAGNANAISSFKWRKMYIY